MRMKREVQLGLFVAFGITALIVSILSIKSFHLSRGYNVHVLYEDVGGLLEKAWVRMSGVDIGRVDKIELGEKQQAMVTVWIRKGVPIRSDSIVKISATGLLGVKYVEFVRQSNTAPLLKDGDYLVGVTPKGLDEVFNSIAESGIVDSLSSTVNNIRDLTTRLSKSLGDDRVESVAESLENTVSDIEALVNDLSDIMGQSKGDMVQIVKNVRSLTDRLDRVMAKIEEGEGTIGKLMSDEEMGESLKDTFDSLKMVGGEAQKVLGRFTLFKSYWNYRLRVDTVDSKYKSDVGLTIRPKPDKFYYIGVNNLTSRDPVGTEEDKNTFNLNIGRDFGPLTVFAGFIRSKGGIGFGLRPLQIWDKTDRLELRAEAYDFERETPVKAAKVNIGASVRVSEYVEIEAGSEDIANTSNFHMNGKLTFEDEDIAYLLGFTGLIPK